MPRNKILFAELVRVKVITAARRMDVVPSELNTFMFLKQH